MIHKKRKKNASFRFYSHTQGRFRPFPACFSRFPACFGRIGSIGRWPIRPIWPIRLDFGRISPILAESARFGANRSRFGTNRAASARIEPSRRESEKKKKKNLDAVRRAGNRVGRCVPRRAASDAGAVPLVPRPCFLAFLMPCSKSPCVPV